MSQIGVPELLIIGGIIILLFGAKKLPDTARALGQSMRLFKKETSKMHEEDQEASVVRAEPVPPPQITTTTSVEERLRLLEEENRRLKASEPTVNGVPMSQAQNDQRSS